VGLLATDGTIQLGLYARPFASLGGEVVVPAQAMQQQVMAAIYGPAGVKATSSGTTVARAAIERVGSSLVERGAHIVLLACTELSLLFSSYPLPAPMPVVDAAQVVAEHVIIEAGGHLRQSAARRREADGDQACAALSSPHATV
jgi:aspartate racemase